MKDHRYVSTELSPRWLDALSLLIALMPLSFAVSGRIKLLPSALLLLAGLVLLIGRRETWYSFRPPRAVVIACAMGLLYPGLNILVHRLGWSAFDRPSHILLFMITAATFSTPLRIRWVWAGFSLTAILLGAVCIVQHYVLGADRAYGLNGGDWSAIEFGMFMLVLALLALVQLLFSSDSRPEKILHAVAAGFGMYGALLTQSRGPLLAYVPIFLLLLLGYARHTGQWRRSLLLFATVICGAVLAGLTLHGEVLDRFTKVGTEVASYNHRTAADGAVRERLEMWHVAGHAILDHPLAGVGIDQFGTYVRQQVADGRANPVIAKYNHAHNEYLEAAATGGIPGLLVLLAVLGLPLAYFARHARQTGPALAPACAGLVVVGMYALCGLSDNVFYRAMPHSLYFFLVLGLAVLISGVHARHEPVPHG